MSEKSAGLPMTAKWDPEKLQQEEAYLAEVESKPFFGRIRGYMKLTGPAWLQSAMTLGAGSAAASVIAGVSFGYKLLWVQPLAMLLGIAMLGALGNVTLTKGERPYRSISRELAPWVAFLWALGSIVASIIWHFPQYGLVGGAAADLAQLAGVASDSGIANYVAKFGAGAIILSLSILVTWNYGSNTRGIKIYEGFLRWTIRTVIIAFLLVVLYTGVNWIELFKGFFTFQIPDVDGVYMVILGAFGAAVGINMTILYPYSILAKGWGKTHKGLSRFDLFSSMFVPYVIVTSLVIIVMAEEIYDPALAAGVRTDLRPVDAAAALGSVLGSTLGRVIFDLGLIGMACGAISTHMVVCGFTFCEMFGLEYTTRRYRLFTLAPAIGILGVAFKYPLWMPVAASAICLTLLPIAYIAFFLMNNKRSYLGDAVGSGVKRLAFNAVLVIAIVAACVGSGVLIKTKVIDVIFP
ncbi:MAG: divalent metal cation transporter [Acidobacteriota bacterium]|nr:MAG: divalent metal cation transporter [Acidobacteriota bacterium]